MVEILSSCSFMRSSLSQSRASAFLPVSATSAFAFGSCKEGWYFRCLDIDPQFCILIEFEFWATEMLLYKQKKSQSVAKGNRLLISITVFGSAGPIWFVVDEHELVAAVIDTALKSYAREGRLPVLDSDLNDFLLLCPTAGTDALSPWDTIGAQGARNFMLCKKPPPVKMENEQVPAAAISRKGSGSWKAWINKSLNVKIPSH